MQDTRTLKVKRSRIRGAGKGLFTTVDIPINTLIIEYRGRLTMWSKVRDGDTAYVIALRGGVVIDAKRSTCIARYANDANGKSKLGGGNNCDYVVFGDHAYIQARRRIRKGEEILVSYGKPYWESYE